MTTKTKTETIYLNESREDWSQQWGSSRTPYTVAFTLQGTRDGTSQPLWQKVISSGGNASTPLSASMQLIKVEPLSAWYNQTRYGKAWSHGSANGCIHATGVTGFPTSHPSYGSALEKANAVAIRELYSKMRSVRSQFAGGIELGQLRMTVHQMVRPASALRKLVLTHNAKMQRLVKKLAKEDTVFMMPLVHQPKGWIGPRRYLRTAEKPTLLKALAETHLEAVYGWSPLISDIRDAAVGVARLVKDLTHQRFRVYGVADQTNGTTSDYTTNLNPWLLRAEINTKVKVTVVYYGAFSDSAMASMAGPALSRLQDMSGFGLRDFVPTVYDLIPWSFVVDYFANIGDVISAACTDTSVVSRLTKVVIVETNSHKVWRVDPTYYNGVWDPKVYKNTVGGTAGVVDKIYRTVTRSQTGVPWLEPRVDIFGPSTSQWLNLAALFVGGRSQRNGYQKGLSFLYG